MSLSRVDKVWIALTSIGLGSLILGALGIAALIMASGCAHPEVATAPEEPLRVVIFQNVPHSAWFCIEDPQIDGTMQAPNVRFGRLVCPLTVGQLRRAIAQLQEAE